METKTQHGYLVLADISGFTSYVAGTELEHANEILTELLELIVARFTPTLTLSKLEGDAVFAYAPESRFSRGEALVELIEATYIAFRDLVENMRRRTTCQCNACRAIPTLDLKFLTHHGDYIIQNVAGIKEMVGSDVNLIHRLLKNHVSEATGWRAYALFTEKGLQHIALPPDGMHVQGEAYEHLGEVKTYSVDLRKRYQELTETRRVVVEPGEADVKITHDFNAPPPVIWDWINDPIKRSQWGPVGHWSASLRPGGRTGTGARNHCAHGKQGGRIENILDWRPFDYVTLQAYEADSPQIVMTQTIQLEPTQGGKGTRLYTYIQLQTPYPHWVSHLMIWVVTTLIYNYSALYAKMGRLISKERP
jgi:hypothetical protein